MNKSKRVMKTIDWLVLILAIFLVIAFAYKITGGGIDPSAISSSTKKMTLELEAYAQDAGMLGHIQVGDVLSESKRNFNAKVTAVSLESFDKDMIVIDERRTEIIKAGQEKARVTIEAELEVKGDVLKLGNQEVRPGIMMFLESEKYKFSTKVLKVEE